MAMKPQKLFYRAIQKIPSGAWHWQIEYENGEPVFFSIQSYTRRFDAFLGFQRIWGRPVTHLEPKPTSGRGERTLEKAKPPAPSKTGRRVVTHQRPQVTAVRKRKSLRKVKRRRSR